MDTGLTVNVDLNVASNLQMVADLYSVRVRTLQRTGAAVIPEMKREAPRDTGALEESISAELNFNATEMVVGSMGLRELANSQYGKNVPESYAADQHETPDPPYSHPKPGAKWKFVEDPAMRSVDLFTQFLAEEVMRIEGTLR